MEGGEEPYRRSHGKSSLELAHVQTKKLSIFTSVQLTEWADPVPALGRNLPLRRIHSASFKAFTRPDEVDGESATNLSSAV